VSPALEAVVTRALAKDPSRRFADAEEMLAAIEEAEQTIEHAPEHEHAHDPDRDPSSTIAMIVRRSWWSRVWSRVRYGRWRWA
jgi:hypothetical protein